MTSQDPTLEPGGPVVERSETGIRILYTLVLYIGFRVAAAVLGVVAVFELLYTLVTRRVAPSEVRAFANRTLTYLYEVTRFASYNQVDAPFPFQGFPPALERMPSEDDLYPSGPEEPEPA
jgi:hypothetical protein